MRKYIFILTALLCLFGFVVACKDDGAAIDDPYNNFIDWETYYYDCDDITKGKIDILLSCEFIPFIENFRCNFRCNEVYFIKGIAQDIVYEYGRNIKLIEDLKGNFPKNITTFTAWGDGYTYIELNRVDFLDRYENQDTLLMLLRSTRYNPKSDSSHIPFYEREGDYTTMTCAYSVLKLANSNVSGYILPISETGLKIINTMQYSDLIKLLKLKLKE